MPKPKKTIPYTKGRIPTRNAEYRWLGTMEGELLKKPDGVQYDITLRGDDKLDELIRYYEDRKLFFLVKSDEVKLTLEKLRALRGD